MTSLPKLEPRPDGRPIAHRSLAAQNGTARDGQPAISGRGLTAPVQQFLQHLTQTNLVPTAAVKDFLQFHGDRVSEWSSPEKLGRALVTAGLLTSYQLDRILAGATHGLVLGNYRVLERLGGGSVGVVFLAEHMLLKRRVAIKVLPADDNFPQSVLERFYSEMRVLAQLDHPHIVAAYDAGLIPAPDKTVQTLHYLVMELMAGDLEQYVYDHGTLPIPLACEWIRQAASGLQQAHDHHLIHRDLKPSNLLRTEQNQIKLVDFGLAREFTSNRTEPRCLLGSVEFMAPEQSIDPTSVRGAADVYGLGATLFWLVCGHTPYQRETSVNEALRRLQVEKPRRLREFMPEAPAELDELVAQMMAHDPDDRPDSPRAVMYALARFATPVLGPCNLDEGCENVPRGVMPQPATPSACMTSRPWQVLILQPDVQSRNICRAIVEPMGCVCYDIEDAVTAMEMLHARPIDLALIDRDMPGMNGYDICKDLREHPPRPHLKVLILAAGGPEDLAQALEHGADDFVPMPIVPPHLAAQIQHALRMKEAQDRLDHLARNLLAMNKQLEHSLQTRDRDVKRTEDALLFAMAKMAEIREGGNASHLRRLPRYCLSLAEQLRSDPAWSSLIDRKFLDNLERCVPLHDIGNIGLPDHILLKTTALTEVERRKMETHTLLGAGLIDAIGKEYGHSLEFLNMARAIVLHHHERYDGKGYPDQLSGEDIPPSARIFQLVDVYDSLRRQRPHRAPLSHADAVQTLLQLAGAFDPAVLRAFTSCQKELEEIFETTT
ncbi:MAG TPA: protein kinase [Gemmataceae bacterium]|nr:protein kinase [Gemmataceae bacterium]